MPGYRPFRSDTAIRFMALQVCGPRGRTARTHSPGFWMSTRPSWTVSYLSHPPVLGALPGSCVPASSTTKVAASVVAASCAETS